MTTVGISELGQAPVVMIGFILIYLLVITLHCQKKIFVLVWMGSGFVHLPLAHRAPLCASGEAAPSRWRAPRGCVPWSVPKTVAAAAVPLALPRAGLGLHKAASASSWENTSKRWNSFDTETSEMHTFRCPGELGPWLQASAEERTLPPSSCFASSTVIAGRELLPLVAAPGRTPARLPPPALGVGGSLT